MFYSKKIRFVIVCFIPIEIIGSETREGSDHSNDIRSHTPDRDLPLIPKPAAIDAIRDESFDDSHASDDSSSNIFLHIDNKRNNVTEPIDDETSEKFYEECFCVEAEEYNRFQRKLNKWFSRGYCNGRYRYSSKYRHYPRFYQQYPRGYRCELMEYLLYQDIAGVMYKVGGIFGIKNSTTLEEKEILLYQDVRRTIQWTWP